jgi:broad specificity phosphatase PhoE
VKITFVRHGNTDKTKRDEDRCLTEKGREQARQFKVKYRVTPQLVLSSNARRALETAQVIVEGRQCPIKTLAELYLAANQAELEVIEALFAAHGYAPLATYLAADRKFFEQYAMRAASMIRQLAATEGANDVLVVGHAIVLNAIGREFSSDPRLLTTMIGEAEGFSIDTDGRLNLLWQVG